MRKTMEEGNQEARERARNLKQHVYMREYVETWPACVICNEHLTNIYPQPKGIGLFRKCGCVGIVWRCSLTGGGWERTTA